MRLVLVGIVGVLLVVFLFVFPIVLPMLQVAAGGVEIVTKALGG